MIPEERLRAVYPFKDMKSPQERFDEFMRLLHFMPKDNKMIKAITDSNEFHDMDTLIRRLLENRKNGGPPEEI